MNKAILFFLILITVSCGPSNHEKGQALYDSYCASCHIAPSIESLPKYLWATKVLPEMGARLGIADSLFNSLKGLSFGEQEAILKTGVYPYTPMIRQEDWNLLKQYVLDMAQDSLPLSIQNTTSKELTQFAPKPISFIAVKSPLYTLLKFDSISHLVCLGDKTGLLSTYDFVLDTLKPKDRFTSGLTDYDFKDGIEYITTVGFLDPSSLASGRIIRKEKGNAQSIPEIFHRPVHTLVHDLDKDGIDEMVVSEFGDLAGSLSLLTFGQDGQYHKKVLLSQPGSIRVLAEDMDHDGRDDLIVQTSQGDESITIFYQEDDLNFRPEKVIRFSPIYGSSWFELIDYDSDGDKDIITVNGDNADETYVQKPYHGMRIFLNDGKNQFDEHYFYALNGATRVIAKDFDQDGDIDFGLLSTFPDYEKHPGFSFVYLANKNAKTFDFEVFTCKESNQGRWFLMDSGDIDADGDEDIILSAFSYSYTPVPKNMEEFWKAKKVDLMILENKLFKNED